VCGMMRFDVLKVLKIMPNVSPCRCQMFPHTDGMASGIKKMIENDNNKYSVRPSRSDDERKGRPAGVAGDN